MDEPSHLSGKKQRQKSQRDRKKQQETSSESSSSSISAPSITSGPQPQRSNRRQRNEAPTSSPSNIPVSTSTPSENEDTKATTEKENVIDFSNLKRETEEIAKLTKKFAKRNISSNWHRYSAPERAEDEGNAEEDAPADFSALIKVPASKGGHLQLKDEQEWSTASNEQLGGYFTLNLKLLNQSLACIPLYEQLRLPKNMFTDEELNNLDTLASDARKAYNPEKDEDSNESICKTFKNLLHKERDSNEKSETIETDNKDSNDISVLNVYGTNEKLFNFDSQPEIISNNSPGSFSNVPRNDKVAVDKDELSIQVVSDDQTLVLDNRSSKGTGTDNLQKNGLTNNQISETATDQVSKMIQQPDETKNFTKEAHDILINTANEISQKSNNSFESTINNSPTDKYNKTTSKTTMKNVDVNGLSEIENTLQLEEDDELDFLLSLKKPGSKKLNFVLEKDVTPQSGSQVTPQPASDQHSELDDWLDSVLQD